MENDIKKLEKYLDDFDNLMDTGWFDSGSIENYTFYHKNMDFDEFARKGREYIRQYLMSKKVMTK